MIEFVLVEIVLAELGGDLDGGRRDKLHQTAGGAGRFDVARTRFLRMIARLKRGSTLFPGGISETGVGIGAG